MKIIKCDNNQNLKDLVKDYNLNISVYRGRYIFKQWLSLLIGQIIYIVFSLKIPASIGFSSLLISTLITNKLIKNNIRNYSDNLSEKCSIAENNLKKIKFSLQKANCFVEMDNFKEDELLFFISAKEKENKLEKITSEISFFDNNKNVNVLRQISKYKGKKLVACEHYLIGEDEYEDKKLIKLTKTLNLFCKQINNPINNK